MSTNSRWKQFLFSPLTRILLGFVGLVGVVAIGQIGTESLLSGMGMEEDFRNLMTGIVAAILAIVAYRYLFNIYEKRDITELSTRGMGRHLLLGVLLGAALQALTILVIYLNGGYTVVSVNPVQYMIPPLTMAITAAIVEEILFRGILFRILEEKWGSYVGLGVSALIFGALHLANPNSSLVTAIGLAIQAGLLLGVAYMFTRNLWFPIAIHFAWNFTETAVFGANVSGNALSKTWLTSRISGPEWITGGAFGPEGSVQATLFCLAATIVLLSYCLKKGQVVKPSQRPPAAR